MRRIFGILTICMLALTVFGQENKSIDILYTVDGSVLKGEIIAWDQDGDLIIKTFNGTEIPIPISQVKKVRQRVIKDKSGFSKRPYAFREEGIYNLSSFGISWGPEPGITATHVIGYRFNRWFGAGVGAGYNNFETGEGKRIIPVFADFRGYLLKKKITPYYAFQAGYGFALTRDDFSLTKAKGGMMINPEIGYRFGAGENINILMGVGLHFQNAEFTTEWDWSDEVWVDEIQYQRVEFKIGMLF